MIKKIEQESKKIENKEILEEKDSALLMIELDRQTEKLEKIKNKLFETEESKLERLKNLLKGK